MKTLLIDGNWNLKRNFHKIVEVNSEGQNCGGVYGFLRSMHTIIKKVLPDRVVVMWDGMFSGKLRYDIYPPYKANRKKMWDLQAKIWAEDFDNITEREEFDFYKQRDYLLTLNDCMYIRQLEVPYIEADDLIAGYILMSEQEERDEQIVIFSRDRDYKQLISSKVSLITPDDVFPITDKNFKKKHGYILENELLFKCFEGDKSDNIQGVNGINKNTLIKLFPDIVDRKYTFKDLCDICERKITQDKDKSKTIRKILESREVLYRNAKLMNLKKPFLNKDAYEMLGVIAHDNHVPEKYELSGMIEHLIKDGYITLLMRDGYDINSFFSPFFRMKAKEREFSRNKKNKKNSV